MGHTTASKTSNIKNITQLGIMALIASGAWAGAMWHETHSVMDVIGIAVFVCCFMIIAPFAVWICCKIFFD